MPTQEEIEAAMHEIAGVFGGDEDGYDRFRRAAKAALEAAERVRMEMFRDIDRWMKTPPPAGRKATPEEVETICEIFGVKPSDLPLGPR
jgi:hypothetical protein